MLWWFLTSDSIVYKHFAGITDNCSTGILMWSCVCECCITTGQRWIGTSRFLQAGCNWQIFLEYDQWWSEAFSNYVHSLHTIWYMTWLSRDFVFSLAIYYLITDSSSNFSNILRTCFSDYANDHAIARELTLQWCHNGCNGTSNPQPHNGLFKILYFLQTPSWILVAMWFVVIHNSQKRHPYSL